MSCADGGQLTTGAVLSTTVTVKLQVLTLLCVSVNVYVTVVAPKANVAPGSCVALTETPPQLSVAVGAVHVADWLHTVLPAPVFTVILAGQLLTVGGSLSV